MSNGISFSISTAKIYVEIITNYNQINKELLDEFTKTLIMPDPNIGPILYKSGYCQGKRVVSNYWQPAKSANPHYIADASTARFSFPRRNNLTLTNQGSLVI